MNFLDEELELDDKAFNLDNLRKTHGARLPHWTSEEAIYHVVYRLADSLPHKVLAQFEEERRMLLRTPILSERDRRDLQYLVSDKVEKYLDSGAGACLLSNPVVAFLVAENIKCFDEVRFRSYAWAIMPNHVHLVLQPLPGNPLPKVVHSLKSFTSSAINKELGRKGVVWQREYYDHLIRDETSLYRTMEYVLNNPKKSGLIEWPWTSANVASAALPMN